MKKVQGNPVDPSNLSYNLHVSVSIYFLLSISLHYIPRTVHITRINQSKEIILTGSITSLEKIDHPIDFILRGSINQIYIERERESNILLIVHITGRVHFQR